VESAHKLGKIAVAMVLVFSASVSTAERREQNGGEASGGSHGDLEAPLGLTGGPTADVRMPRRVHAVATACGWSATELSSFLIQRPTTPTNRASWTP
jgi:hypothetical protein